MDRFRTMVEFMNWMWENGVLHPEYATMSDPGLGGAGARHLRGRSHSREHGLALLFVRRQMPGIDQGKFYPVMSLTVDGEKILWPAPSNVWLGNPLVISGSSSQAEIEASVWLIDYLFSTEGRFLIYQGKEGVDWTYRADGTKCLYGHHSAPSEPEGKALLRRRDPRVPARDDQRNGVHQ